MFEVLQVNNPNPQFQKLVISYRLHLDLHYETYHHKTLYL